MTVWRKFARDGLCDLLRTSERMKAEKYQRILYVNLIPFDTLLGGVE